MATTSRSAPKPNGGSGVTALKTPGTRLSRRVTIHGGQVTGVDDLDGVGRLAGDEHPAAAGEPLHPPGEAVAVVMRADHEVGRTMVVAAAP